jgi:hypothetical protein
MSRQLDALTLHAIGEASDVMPGARSLLRESDACLELLEQAILADLPRVPRPLRDRVARLAAAAGHRRTTPPADPAGVHAFVFEVQDERLLVGAPGEPLAVPRKPRRAPRRWGQSETARA